MANSGATVIVYFSITFQNKTGNIIAQHHFTFFVSREEAELENIHTKGSIGIAIAIFHPGIKDIHLTSSGGIADIQQRA